MYCLYNDIILSLPYACLPHHCYVFQNIFQNIKKKKKNSTSFVVFLGISSDAIPGTDLAIFQKLQ